MKQYLNVESEEHAKLGALERSSDFQPGRLETLPSCPPLIGTLQLFQSHELLLRGMSLPLFCVEGSIQGHDTKHLCEVARPFKLFFPIPWETTGEERHPGGAWVEALKAILRGRANKKNWSKSSTWFNR